MKQPPALARWLLNRFVSCTSPALHGDLEEEYQSRSSGWYWRQVLGAIVTGVRKDIRDHPILALQAMATGWIVLLLIFALGDRTAEAIAKYAWNWSRFEDGYGAGLWWPFWVAASCVSYCGFAISAWAVARLHGAYGMAMVLAYLASVLTALVASAAIIDWLARPIALPHTFYYVVSVALPFMRRSGFILVPLVILLTGLVSCRTAAAQNRASGPASHIQ